MPRLAALFLLLAATTAATQAQDAPPPAAAPQGMAYIPAGTFTMGSDRPAARYDEKPAHPVTIDGFWIDRTEVTNAQFRAFVEATGYVTTAERAVDWEEMRKQVPPGTPKPPADALQPGSLVFNPPDRPVDLRVYSQWWRWTNGASWRHPQGPGSSIEGKDDWPVVQVSWDDANAYAAWAGKRLPTEAEWERAARLGRDGDRFTWGDQLTPDNTHMANIWQGTFPHANTADDGFARIAPVKSFPPNAAGLYDMAGNVWEWTSDRFHPDTYRKRIAQKNQPGADGSCCVNPTGPDTAADPRNPYAQASYVQKGGSFLCHASYCESYRPSAKMAAPPDTGLMHLGFRCVMDAPPPNE
ncbi:MAG: formylglycine-generating enzyme family protein [Planctomycetota bacterium]